MKRILIGIVIVLIVVGFSWLGYMLYALNQFGRVLTTEEKTAYSKTYSNAKFKSIKIGDDYKSVIETLGAPLVEKKMDFVEQFLYLDKPENLYFSKYSLNIVHLKKDRSVGYKLITLNKLGEVTNLRGNNYLTKFTSQEIRAFSKNEVIKKLGVPEMQRICDGESTVLHYTAKNAPPKTYGYNVRQIIIKNDTVFMKLESDGGGKHHKPYHGVCNIIDNWY